MSTFYSQTHIIQQKGRSHDSIFRRGRRLGYHGGRPVAWVVWKMIVLLGIVLLIFGLWACMWGAWACFNRPRPHDLLGGLTALCGITALGFAAALILQSGFLG